MDIYIWPLPQWLIDIGTLSSIIGFGITIAVYIETKSLKNVFKRKVRLPELQKQLRESTSKINGYMEDWEEKKDSIKQEFANCAVFAESISDKLASKDKLKIRDFLDEVKTKKFLRREKISIVLETSDSAWKLYAHLNTLNSRVDEIVNDMKLD
ncbi:hypothetical protein ABRP58_03380 [Pectobacterium aroidearum]|uniref:hypothetical protein n=1 Tax=Pectobacterium aroidearum TaxID=1201031 RepID=UPI0032EDAA5B